MKPKKAEPVVGKIYRHKHWSPDVLLIQVLEYPVMAEDHPYDDSETVIMVMCLDGTKDVCHEKLEEFWEMFEEATPAEIALYSK